MYDADEVRWNRARERWESNLWDRYYGADECDGDCAECGENCCADRRCAYKWEDEDGLD